MLRHRKASRIVKFSFLTKKTCVKDQSVSKQKNVFYLDSLSKKENLDFRRRSYQFWIYEYLWLGGILGILIIMREKLLSQSNTLLVHFVFHSVSPTAILLASTALPLLYQRLLRCVKSENLGLVSLKMNENGSLFLGLRRCIKLFLCIYCKFNIDRCNHVTYQQ